MKNYKNYDALDDRRQKEKIGKRHGNAPQSNKIDGNVADVINKRKDKFYDKYYYLKPECEFSSKYYNKNTSTQLISVEYMSTCHQD